MRKELEAMKNKQREDIVDQLMKDFRNQKLAELREQKEAAARAREEAQRREAMQRAKEWEALKLEREERKKEEDRLAEIERKKLAEAHFQQEKLAAQKFVGLSVYVFDDGIESALARVDAAVWAWLEKRRWLISVNSKGARWAVFVPVLERHPQLRLLVSHLGLPPAVEGTMTEASVHQRLGSVKALARFPGVCVKLSGFYALTVPGYDYPHRNAWPYVAALIESFGVQRLLWGSDFSPSLEVVSFPQTIELLAQMPFLTDKDREQIEGTNLLRILGEV